MIIEFGINPNCSEATIRVRTQGQPRKKIDALIKELKKKMDPDITPTGDWDDDDEHEDDSWSEGYVDENIIFGIDVLEITGDAPFNYGDQVIATIKKYLPNAEMEYKEP